MTTSILNDVKKVVGLSADYTAFDLDLVMHINSVFSTLTQLGVGPESGFEIEDDSATWDALLGNDNRFNFVKTYVYLRVRQLFDPPATSFLIISFKEQIQELEWRISVLRESSVLPTVEVVRVIDGGSSA